ncbi:hypothetical protein [Microbacterium sp. MTN4-26]|uniref:hypothetical protein n=1 Tax=unclassified Microbacterium TaxID=2609290 RepID=UPI0036F427DF
MTDAPNEDTKPKYRIEDDPDEPDWSDLLSPDYGLEDVLDHTLGAGDEAEDAEISLTIVLQGVLVSGRAITRRAWVDGMTAIGGDKEGSVANALKKLWSSEIDAGKKMRARREAAELPQYARRHVYMKDTQILPAGGSSIVNAGFFRARISEIGGWTLGVAAPANPVDD